MLTVDKHWADGVGYGFRPFAAADHLRDVLIQDLTVKNTANDKAIYLCTGSEFEYLRGKGAKDFRDKVKYPPGKGIWFKTLTLRNAVIDGVARKDNAKIQGAHTDGIYIGSDVGANNSGAKTDMLIDGATLRNCDGSCMAVLIQNPTKIGTLTFRKFICESTVVQKRIVIKTGVWIDKMVFDSCAPCAITPDNNTFHLGSVEIINSPGVTTEMLEKLKIPITRR